MILATLALSPQLWSSLLRLAFIVLRQCTSLDAVQLCGGAGNYITGIALRVSECGYLAHCLDYTANSMANIQHLRACTAGFGRTC